jgi:hypothetical protein
MYYYILNTGLDKEMVNIVGSSYGNSIATFAVLVFVELRTSTKAAFKPDESDVFFTTKETNTVLSSDTQTSKTENI